MADHGHGETPKPTGKQQGSLLELDWKQAFVVLLAVLIGYLIGNGESIQSLGKSGHMVLACVASLAAGGALVYGAHAATRGQ
jgi:hypothetical protein